MTIQPLNLNFTPLTLQEVQEVIGQVQQVPDYTLPYALPEKITSKKELRQVMEDLPLLRKPQDTITSQTVVVCHVSDLVNAIDWYSKTYSSLPTFYIDGTLEEISVDAISLDVCIYKFSELTPDMEIQLYFKQAKAPMMGCHFGRIATYLHAKGIIRYSLARHCTEILFCRNTQEILSDEEFDIVMAFYNKLADQASKYTYLGVCKAREKAEPGYIPIAPYYQYQHPSVHAESGDCVCEGGPADGVTTMDLANVLGSEGELFAFEPKNINVERSTTYLDGMENIHLENKALWSSSTTLAVIHKPFCHVLPFKDGMNADEICQAVSIDDYFTHKRPPACIKLDVEGAEIPVLEGARKNLLAHMPKLLISMYHRNNGRDFINIPNFFLNLPCDYTFYVGHHFVWYNETVLYAIHN